MDAARARRSRLKAKEGPCKPGPQGQTGCRDGLLFGYFLGIPSDEPADQKNKSVPFFPA